ncbi:acetate--CoA ligase family protein [Blastococcus sp. URHD0036]|uniref:acetate--CoA ligase family protein n=1 Tax=Blastococcus sp. URHD0036 TaxID=1380356 RepID=UPI000494DB02|nr:acetate--CoA ligase family protein [Blastococcus sp. URHD0036]
MSAKNLIGLFAPASVAIIGASTTPGKIGTRVVDNLLSNGYPGRVYPVNARGGEIAGLPVYRDIASLPEAPEVAYVLIPADAAVAAAQELAERGTAYIIVAAAGFAESGTEDGRRRELALREIAEATGTRIVGPNCNGTYSATHQASIGFNTAHGMRHRAGGVAILSHSGALFSTLMLRAATQGMGLSAFVSVGNECDLTVVDYMAHFVDDAATSCIALIIDSIPDGDRFRELVGSAHAAGKSVLALKLGTSDVGASAAVAHSSRLAGRAEAYESFLGHLGVGLLDTVEELVAAAALVDTPRRIRARASVGVAAMSGGAATILADAATRAGVRVPPLSGTTRDRISSIAPQALIENPIDLGGSYGQIDTPTMFELLADDPSIDVVLHYYHPMSEDADRARLADQFIGSAERSGKPHLLLAPGGITDAERERYDAARLPVMIDTGTAMTAIAAASAQAPEPVAPQPAARPITALSGSGVLDDAVSIALLAEAGVPMTPVRTATTPAEVLAAAHATGPIVVLKGLLEGVAHKSDLGLVAVGVRGDEEVAAQAERLFGLGVRTVMVQPMATGEVEALLGVVTEPRLGRFVVFGLGGVFTEDLRDVAMVPVWASPEQMRTALSATRLGAVLHSPRRQAGASTERFLDAIVTLARWARTVPQLEAVDINPVLIGTDDVVGVDGLIVLADSTAPGSV